MAYLLVGLNITGSILSFKVYLSLGLSNLHEFYLMNAGKAQWTINYPLLYTFPCEIMFFGNLMKREKSGIATYSENSFHGMDKLLSIWFCF